MQLVHVILIMYVILKSTLTFLHMYFYVYITYNVYAVHYFI